MCSEASGRRQVEDNVYYSWWPVFCSAGGFEAARQPSWERPWQASSSVQCKCPSMTG